VQYFLQFLRNELSNSTMYGGGGNPIDAAAIRDAIEASVFFATSLGRLGADFTSQLSPIFEPILVETITRYWIDGVVQLRDTLTICRDAGVAGPLATEVGTRSMTDDEGDFSNYPPLDEPQPPPKRLLRLPPLARFVNAVLNGLNEFRRCLLPGVFPSLRRFLKVQVLEAVAQELQNNERTVLTPGFKGEAAALRSVANLMSTTFRDIVELYLLGALEAAIGYKDAARNYHKKLRDNLKGLRAKEVDVELHPSESNVSVDNETADMVDEEPNDSLTPPIIDDYGLTNDDDDVVAFGTDADDTDSPDHLNSTLPSTLHEAEVYDESLELVDAEEPEN
jgi:hypothetical protein